MAIDPATGFAMAKGAWDLGKSIFGKKKTPKPVPVQQQMQALPQRNPADDPINNPWAQQMQCQLMSGQSFLPQNYRDAIMGPALESLNYQRDLGDRRILENANQHGLLGGGAPQVRLGMQDRNYAVALGQMNAAMMEQDNQARRQAQGLMGNVLGMQNQRVNAYDRIQLPMAQQNANNQNMANQQQFAYDQDMSGTAWKSLGSAFDAYQSNKKRGQRDNVLANGKAGSFSKSVNSDSYRLGGPQYGNMSRQFGKMR